MIGLSQNLYIDKVLKMFSIDNSRKGFLPCNHGVHLSREMGPKTDAERQHMQKIHYALAIGSLMYAMLCIRPV